MSHQFKPGDLALMLPNGRTVQILEALGRPEKLVWGGLNLRNRKNENVWLVEFLSAPMLDILGQLHKTGPLTDSRLMPLKGDEQPAQARQAERVQ